MECAELTLVIHYAKDLKDVKHLGTMDPYAVVWIAGYGKESEKVTTPVSQKRGCYPEWDYSIKFHIVPMKREYSLFIQIKHDGTIIDRHIGEVEDMTGLASAHGKKKFDKAIKVAKKVANGGLVTIQFVLGVDLDDRTPKIEVGHPQKLRKIMVKFKGVAAVYMVSFALIQFNMFVVCIMFEVAIVYMVSFALIQLCMYMV
ncbi:hypothetical protein L2E82_09897 [Cichorium intybus]|uniref:Uncharacterized protein n=1 Tax=Cichorium intybus TaxID=13427 RepID=A0ACB9G8X1_CICIN|nr:hypothetical protein L2E82_09897 [Cichorium intybus]